MEAERLFVAFKPFSLWSYKSQTDLVEFSKGSLQLPPELKLSLFQQPKNWIRRFRSEDRKLNLPVFTTFLKFITQPTIINMSSKVDYTTRKGSRGNPFSVLIPAILKRSVRQWNFIVANDSNGSHRCRNSANIRRNATLTLLIVVSSSCIDLAFCGQLSPSSLNGLGKGGSSTGSSGGKDSGGGKGLEDSESPLSLHHHHPHHRPHHHRYNNRQDRHGGSGSASSKNSVYSSSLYPSDSASLTYQDYSSSFGYYPGWFGKR